MASAILGAVIYVCGAGLIALGENLVKLSNTVAADSGRCCSPTPWRTWFAGVFAFVLGNGTHFVSFGFAAQSLLESLGATILLWNLLMAPAFHKERVRRRHLVATGIIATGTVLAIAFGSKDSKAHELSELLHLFQRRTFIIYEAVLLFGALMAHEVYVHESRHASRSSVAGLLESGISRSGGCSWRNTTVIPLTYAAASAMVGSNAVLFSNCLSESLRVVLEGGAKDVGLAAPVTLVLAFLVIAGFWLYRLNTALRMFPSLLIVPALSTIWMCCSVVSGGVFFQEFEAFTAAQMLRFIFAVIVIIAGVIYMPAHSESDALENSFSANPTDGSPGKEVEMNPDSDNNEVESCTRSRTESCGASSAKGLMAT